jgi:hypothetical protein
MAFNLDHTRAGDLSLAGSYVAFSGSFRFPKPTTPGGCAVFLTTNSATIDSIVDLQTCLNCLVPSNEIGTASTLSSDNGASSALLVGNNDLINHENLPDLVKSCVFVVDSSNQLTLLNQAQRGSLAFTRNSYKTYVLCDSFNNINNWVQLAVEDICIKSLNSLTGVVSISGSHLSSSSQFGGNVETGIQRLFTGYISNSDLISTYMQDLDLGLCLGSYSTFTDLSSELSAYKTENQVSTCLLDYTDNNGTGSLFSPYVLQDNLGEASESQYNYGTGVSCILCVGSQGFIDDSVLPDISLVEAFTISSQSDLTSLTTATIGDVAFDTVNKLNYILSSCAVGGYSTAENWKQFSAESGSLLNVNNHTADPNSTVTIYSDDVCLIDNPGSLTVSDVLALIESSVGGIQSDYKSSGAFVSDRQNYVTTSVFDSIASQKADAEHTTLISDVENLDSCISSISPFSESNLINLQKSYSYQLSNSGLANSCGSLILGDQAKSKSNYSLVQGAGKFNEFGDAQYQSLVQKLSTNDSEWNSIFNIQMDANSIVLLNASFVSRHDDAFRLEGAVVREVGNSCLPNDLAKSIYSTGTSSNDVRLCTNSSGFALQVKGQSYWMGNLEMVSTKSSGAAPSELIGLYWNNSVDSDWFNVGGNWFTENTLTTQATSLPSGSSDVFMNGSVAAVVDLDNADWVQPNSIDTTSVTDSKGIVFTSANNEVFNGVIYGNASFSGNASFQ